MYLLIAKNPETGRQPGKLGRDIAEIGETEHQHGEKRHTQPEFFPNQIGKTLAGNGPHAGRHFLHDNERDGGGNQGPEKGVTVFCARLGVG